ncbi:hypothetical protein [Paenibacillus flagellatus]|uniref:Uncharacterized protein n=1 Tax=Paenibacillus flagellatus TaxID=2211139 RepID=A0A2V5K3H8_9BACL|nr:hypothetical protein [Paenibacillus flagellatus]PYI53788.1 hypothetical protein DLM86_14600 [Paenibacillus flagellatus]
MTLSRNVRTIVLLAFALSLLWTFLVPTAERVVTPVSKTIPAVSAKASFHSPSGAPAHPVQKLRLLLALVAVFMPFPIAIVRADRVRIRLQRFAPPVALLRKQLLLRSLRFGSRYL